MKKLIMMAGIMSMMYFLRGCQHETPEPVIEYVVVKDSTDAIQIVNLKEELRRTRDSLNAYKNDTTMSEELFIAKFKLEKIRYYTEIANKGNNIKFYRGWVLRTLQDE